MKSQFIEWLGANGFERERLTQGQMKTLYAAYKDEADRNGVAAGSADFDGSINFTADVEIVAAAAGDSAKPATFSINAYSGGPMRLNGYAHPVVVDLGRASVAREDVPVLLNHDDEKLVGQGRATINSTGISIAGKVTGNDGAAAHVVGHAKNGFKWQASIGGHPGQLEHVPHGNAVTVNGKQVNGPAIIARGFTLKEVSFVPVGADQASSAEIAAKEQGMSVLNTSNAIASANNESILLERKRISEIRAMAKDHADIQGRAIDEGWSLERTELEVLRQGRDAGELKNLRAGRPNPPQAIAAGADELYAEALPAAMLISSGLSESTVGKYYPEAVMNMAVSARLRGAGIQSAFRAVLQAAGKYEDIAAQRFTADSIRASFEASGVLQAAGFSTISLPGILGDYLHKQLLASYDAQEVTWDKFCAIRPLDDFKPLHIFRMVGAGAFKEVGATGELHHIELDEQDYTVQANTYGALIVLTRQMVTNDDLSAFGDIAAIMGRLGAVKLEQIIYTLLLSNAGSFFSTDNGNYLTGGGSALALGALSSAEKAFLLQVDNNGLPILVSPRTLLVGPTNAVTARQLIGSTDLLQTALQSASGAGIANQQPSGNPFVKQLTPAVSPWIENATIVGNSTTRWYLAASPTVVAPVLVGFLHGTNKPTVQSGEASFDTLGLQFRSFFDFGASLGDYRGMLMSDGA